MVLSIKMQPNQGLCAECRFYTKTKDYTWTFPTRPYMQGHVDEHFVRDDAGYRTNYYGNVLTGSGVRTGDSGQACR